MRDMKGCISQIPIAALVFLFVAAPATAATLEFLNGTTIQCTVLSKDETNVTIEVMMGASKVKRTIPLASVHKVTINAKEYLINEKPAGGKSKTGSSKTAKSKATGSSPLQGSGDPAASGSQDLRTKAEIDALIDQMGRKPPDWFEATPLNYPETLDLDWPDKPPGGGWNNQKNVGQYIWDIINPNQTKWREGVRLLHHLLTLHKDDAAKRTRIMNSLGVMYHNLHEDYARAAFWWRQAGVDKGSSNPGNAIHLAECYWRLGNKQMAVDLMKKVMQGTVPYNAIKLWADMGEVQQAQKLADAIARSPGAAQDLAYLYVADGHRVAGRYPQALQYYQKVLDFPAKDPGKGRIDRSHKRAQASLEAIKLFEILNVSQVADGKYQDQSQGYEGPVRVEVVVREGKIETVEIVQHREKQYYSSLTDTPAKIIAKQGVKGVDSTSGATITSEAIINAAAKALAGGAK
jgi:uncharacterized protein with FMN-binding domain